MDDDIATEDQALTALEIEPADLPEIPEGSDLPEDGEVPDEEEGA